MLTLIWFIIYFIPEYTPLLQHIKRVHEAPNTAGKSHKTNIQCIECKELFNGSIDLYMHSKIHEKISHETPEGYNLHCDECAIDLKTVTKYTEHVMRQHNIKKNDVKLVRCHWCGHRCKNTIGLFSHIRYNHKYDGAVELITSDLVSKSKVIKCDTMLCNVCGKVLRRGISYKQHMAIHANDRKFACDLCPATFMYVSRWRI